MTFSSFLDMSLDTCVLVFPPPRKLSLHLTIFWLGVFSILNLVFAQYGRVFRTLPNEWFHLLSTWNQPSADSVPILIDRSKPGGTSLPSQAFGGTHWTFHFAKCCPERILALFNTLSWLHPLVFSSIPCQAFHFPITIVPGTVPIMYENMCMCSSSWDISILSILTSFLPLLGWLEHVWLGLWPRPTLVLPGCAHPFTHFC